MQLVPRTQPTSTCPLCRDEVERATGIACGTCGAVAHLACVEEFGGCHTPQDTSPRARSERLRTQRERATRARLERERLRQAQEGGRPPPADVSHWFWVGALGVIAVLAGATQIGMTQGGQNGVVFGLAAAGAAFGIYQLTQGVFRGSVLWFDKHDPGTIYRLEEHPFEFFAVFTFWLVGTLAAAGLAAYLFWQGT